MPCRAPSPCVVWYVVWFAVRCGAWQLEEEGRERGARHPVGARADQARSARSSCRQQVPHTRAAHPIGNRPLGQPRSEPRRATCLAQYTTTAHSECPAAAYPRPDSALLRLAAHDSASRQCQCIAGVLTSRRRALRCVALLRDVWVWPYGQRRRDVCMARTAFRCAAFALGFPIRASLFGEGGGRQRDGSARSDGRAKVNTSRSHASGMQARASCSADAEGLAQKMGLKFFRVCTQENMNVDRGSWCRIGI
jgi:hypothetical protein